MTKYSVEYYCYATHIIEAESAEDAFNIACMSTAYPSMSNIPIGEEAEIDICENMGYEVYLADDTYRGVPLFEVNQ